MKCIKTIIFILASFMVNAQAQQRAGKPLASSKNKVIQDWLVGTVNAKASIDKSADGKSIILHNGLVKRAFILSPDVACIDYINLTNNQQLLRAVKPEACITIDGIEYNIGGLYGQKENAYLLPQWINTLKSGDSSFHFVSYNISDIQPLLKWKSSVWTANTKQPQGKMISFKYASSLAALKDLEITVNYELYDGLPLICKWLTIRNNSKKHFKLNRVVNEVLAVVEEESAVVGGTDAMHKPSGIYIESNYAFNNAMRYDLSDQTLHWKVDKAYTSQVNYDYNTPCLLEIYPEKAPGIELQSDELFTSVKSYELLQDSYDRERRGLAVRKMYNTIAPWTTGNPIFMHLVSRNDEQVKTAIDQCAATGYEALILSFGSHLNMEDNSGNNLQKWKSLTEYAHSKGIKIGGYSLFSSRKISDEDDVVDPKTGKPGGAFFGNAPCFGSKWGLAYRDKIKTFFTATGFDIWENDGPYPGDVCASVTHPGHKGLDDSQWRQMEIQKELYHWLAERGVYINAPDWYFLDGTNKIGLGYREVNFSLPRDQQKILNRQNIFDGTWEKTASMSWGFVPLTRYQGGGPEAVLEPLKDHLKDYDQLMMQYYGAGVQACYRGPRLYDTDTTKQVVINIVNWYKKYRAVLNSPIIHLRRADGRDWDGLLHVNPSQKIKGLFMLYNPINEKITRTIKLPLYYTGLTDVALIREKENAPVKYKLNRDYTVDITVTLEPDTYSWWVIE